MKYKIENPSTGSSLAGLLDAVHSYSGINGGDPKNPIWFCSLEWGYGFFRGNPKQVDLTNIFNADFKDNSYLTLQTAKDYLRGKFGDDIKGRRGGSAYYRSMITILTALIEDKDSHKELTRAKIALDKYEFYGENRLGFSFNLSPISISGRTNAETEWKKTLLKVSESSELVSFQDWTGIPTYREFFKWCAKERFPIFKTFREKYNPKIIYCAGINSFDDYKTLWLGSDSYELKSVPSVRLGNGKDLPVKYTWINEKTLLVIGPFFGVKYYLNSYEGNFALARTVKKIIKEKHHCDEWLELKAFLTQ